MKVLLSLLLVLCIYIVQTSAIRSRNDMTLRNKVGISLASELKAQCSQVQLTQPCCKPKQKPCCNGLVCQHPGGQCCPSKRHCCPYGSKCLPYKKGQHQLCEALPGFNVEKLKFADGVKPPTGASNVGLNKPGKPSTVDFKLEGNVPSSAEEQRKLKNELEINVCTSLKADCNNVDVVKMYQGSIGVVVQFSNNPRNHIQAKDLAKELKSQLEKKDSPIFKQKWSIPFKVKPGSIKIKTISKKDLKPPRSHKKFPKGHEHIGLNSDSGKNCLKHCQNIKKKNEKKKCLDTCKKKADKDIKHAPKLKPGQKANGKKGKKGGKKGKKGGKKGKKGGKKGKKGGKKGKKGGKKGKKGGKKGKKGGKKGKKGGKNGGKKGKKGGKNGGKKGKKGGKNGGKKGKKGGKDGGKKGKKGDSKGSKGKKGDSKGSKGKKGDSKGSKGKKSDGKGSKGKKSDGKGSKGKKSDGKGSKGKKSDGKGSKGKKSDGKGSKGKNSKKGGSSKKDKTKKSKSNKSKKKSSNKSKKGKK